MSKEIKEVTEKEIDDVLSAFRDEAVKNMVNAFNEGFLLGVRHAKTVFSEPKEAKDE